MDAGGGGDRPENGVNEMLKLIGKPPKIWRRPK